MKYKAEVSEKGARAWVCSEDGTRQFSVPIWAVDMVVKAHNDAEELPTIKIRLARAIASLRSFDPKLAEHIEADQ